MAVMHGDSTSPETSNTRDGLATSLTTRPWSTQRMWFPRVFLRKLVGHVQGIAFHLERNEGDPSDKLSVLCSVSHFPRGWGAILVNNNMNVVDPEISIYSEMTSIGPAHG